MIDDYIHVDGVCADGYFMYKHATYIYDTSSIQYESTGPPISYRVLHRSVFEPIRTWSDRVYILFVRLMIHRLLVLRAPATFLWKGNIFSVLL